MGLIYHCSASSLRPRSQDLDHRVAALVRLAYDSGGEQAK